MAIYDSKEECEIMVLSRAAQQRSVAAWTEPFSRASLGGASVARQGRTDWSALPKVKDACALDIQVSITGRVPGGLNRTWSGARGGSRGRKGQAMGT